jgi:hypothetical protein
MGTHILLHLLDLLVLLVQVVVGDLQVAVLVEVLGGHRTEVLAAMVDQVIAPQSASATLLMVPAVEAVAAALHMVAVELVVPTVTMVAAVSAQTLATLEP